MLASGNGDQGFLFLALVHIFWAQASFDISLESFVETGLYYELAASGAFLLWKRGVGFGLTSMYKAL